MSHASNFSIANSLRAAGVSLCGLVLASSISHAVEVASASPDSAGLAFFENKIRPVLVQHCYKCHAADAKSVKAGLLLDTKHGVLSGGTSGASVVPGKPDDSPLLSALRYDDYEMPPSGQLPESVIADFDKWIRMGAPDPRVDAGFEIQRRDIDIAAGRDFWAFQPVQTTAPPRLANDNWSSTDTDRFIYAKLMQESLTPVSDADPATWYRRMTFDLVGLPPTPTELRDFQRSAKRDLDAAKSDAVNQLLDSPQFGERWGRHWLDLARYAESTGRTRNYPFPFAWRYRDYVIHSFNEDKPYDLFVKEQLAGDLMVRKSTDGHPNLSDHEELLTATGFLAVGSPDLNERNGKIYQMDMVADQIDTTGRAMLGLTVGCARCHDHKFDPIPTEDYYALAGIFKSTQLLNGYASRTGGGNKARSDLLIPLGPPLDADETEKTAQELKDEKRLAQAQTAKAQAAADVERIKKNKKLGRKQRNQQIQQAKRTLTRRTRALNQLRKKLKGNVGKFTGPACLGVRDAAKIADCRVHVQGDTTKLGDEVPRGFLQVVAPFAETSLAKDESGRLELANWIANADNPLTARVYVNRVWRHLFGAGLVRTVDNLGYMGARPTHPELLDYLANRFIENGWSTKTLIRDLVLTRVYGLSIDSNSANESIDETNSFLWRMNSRRLDYEALRDSLLAISGKLELSPPQGSIVEAMKTSEISKQQVKVGIEDSVHRSIYLPIIRNHIPDDMSYFDFPDPSETRGARDATNVPTQSLYLLNNPFVVRLARFTAKDLMELDARADGSLMEAAYLRVLGREILPRERNQLSSYMNDRLKELQALEQPRAVAAAQARKQRETVLSEIIHAMFASAEFRYR